MSKKNNSEEIRKHFFKKHKANSETENLSEMKI